MPKGDESRVRFREDVGPKFKEGDSVEYRSASTGWIPAKVLKVKGDLYDLDCKQDVPPDRMRMTKDSESAFSSGDLVEYFSASQGKWIPAKVLLRKQDGRLDLDCKQDVVITNVRKPDVTAATSFAPGDHVEYYSSSQANWISATVRAVKAGRIDLDCKPDVLPEHVRRPLPPPGSEPLPTLLEQGQAVEYFGAKLQRWIPAKVLKRNSDGTYDLDCKTNVQPAKVRRLKSASLESSPSSTVTLAPYKEGDRVEYFSGSQSRWIPARVLGVTPEGRFHLDCKSDVPAEKIRPPSKKTLDYQVGDVVDYFGASKGLWISTKVLKINEDGTFDLACKPRVLPENMRKAVSTTEALEKGPVFNLGDSVEYFGVSQNRWIPAKVVSMTSAGNYNLDVKQDVPVDRIRSGLARADRPAPGDPGSPSQIRAASAAMQPGSTLSAVAALPEPLQLLRYTRRSGLAGGYKLEVCQDAVETLEKMGQRPVVAISLCGTGQSGKTYLANLLLDRPQQGQQVLQVGGGLWSTARTEGVWLWAGGVDKDERSPLILLLDCEGFGGAGATTTDDSCHGASRDMQILALSWLLSSALVMNCTGSLNEALFDQLKSASRFGDLVEERGTEAYGKPALLWFLRDFDEVPQDEKGRSMTADEYLEKSLHEASKESARKAGSVRHGLLKFFRHRSCHFAPSPGSRPESLSYSALAKPFKAAVEQFRSKLFSTALACPKAVNGKPLGCVAFTALLRQLVAGVNDGRILSLHAAWESVQHTFCGSLADELRAEASTLFQTLAAGRSIAGGAKLPLSEEALFTVVRDRKRALKGQWEERAFGDETVRRTYWKELKASLTREENMVRTQNARVADQQLMEGVKSWQEWLDKEDDTGIDEICSQLGALLARMPCAPLSRASRIAIQAAARRMSAMRSAVTHALERQTDLQRKAVAWGEKAAQQEGTARSELEAQKAALEEAAARAQQAEEECTALCKEVETKEAQLEGNRESLEEQLNFLEASKLREQEMKAKQRVLNESEASLRKDLEQARADVARIDAERFAAERSATNAAAATQAEQERLKELLAEAQRKIDETKLELAKERDTHGSEKTRLQQEHEQRVQELRTKHEDERQVLRSKQDQTREEHNRMAEEMRQRLENERQEHNRTKDDDKGRLLEHSRTAGLLEGKIIASTEENKALRLRLETLEEKAHETEVAIRTNLEEEKVLRAKIRQAQTEVARMKDDMDSKLKAAADELDAQEREMQEREADMLRAATGFSRKGQPKCGCRIQ
ncbi:Guanylate-binding protein 1 (GTP-binding protein 1) (GBP-1) (mGBP-1) (mGBP1) (Guanine nucleotide-binding protein 1) (Interferon-gamma-inducible protein MAG-1) (Interferon-induced guanylate-binding protein 1) [Durusdinium trenchii]|uniref:Guanylate-binding protein N-terminal domain-containing protein n=1 Tax=Durusdinium trenchii TaxID=1381693 RepID=A0ABP0PKW3_9DINO